MNPVTVIRGAGPLILGQPHSGTWLPAEMASNLNSTGATLGDTDWHVPRLYEGLLEDVTVVRANFSRYVIDANRDPGGVSLYPGKSTTELVPLTNFDGQSIWKNPPDPNKIEAQRMSFHRAYHQALAEQIQRVKDNHGTALLYDCHSIRSTIPWLFEGQLPDLNIGTNNDATCAPSVGKSIATLCKANGDFTHVINGRFRGGWTTRHYGQPAHDVHAVQMELSQRCYLICEQSPFDYDATKAVALRALLRNILVSLQSTVQSFAL